MSFGRRLAVFGVSVVVVTTILVVCRHAVNTGVFVLMVVLGTLVVYVCQPLAGAWQRRIELRRLAATPPGAVNLLGEAAVVVEAINPVGKVKVHGEIWNARSVSGATIGGHEIVTVVGCEGFELKVEPRESEQ